MTAPEHWTLPDITGAPRSGASRWYAMTKRALDMTVSSALLVILGPLLMTTALAIRADSPGPVLHRRRVAGRGGRPFYAFKLRTMVEDGALQIAQDSRLIEEFNNNHKLKADPRVTRVGRILRKASIDELPQLVNVLRGEMSLVGPRMISFPELEKFGEWQERILEVKPGITGLWQVSGRSDLDYEDRVRLNAYYVNHRSLALDLWILAKTIPVVISGRGAY